MNALNTFIVLSLLQGVYLDDLKPCFKSSVSEGVRIEQSEKWFASAQIHSYCRNIKADKNDTSCNETCRYSTCIAVCFNPKNITECESACKTTYCKLGCQFYDSVFNKNTNRTIDETDFPPQKPIKIIEQSNINNISYKWSEVSSKSNLTSVYLISILPYSHNTKTYEKVLGITTFPAYVVSTDQMCSHVYQGTHFNDPQLKFSIRVYPVNANGPSDIKEAMNKTLVFKSGYHTPIPLKPLDFVDIENPYYQKIGEEDSITWKATWNKTMVDKRASGIVRKYELDTNSCRSQDWAKEIADLNLLQMESDFKQGNTIIMINTKNDHLVDCRVKAVFAVKYGGCFLSNTTQKSILYKGCETVKNFPYQCPIPVIPEKIDTSVRNENISITSFSKTCEKTKEEKCLNQTTDAIEMCTSCEQVHYRINVTWPMPKFPKAYKVQHIEFSVGKPGMFKMGLIDANTTILPPNATFHALDYPFENANKKREIGIIIFAKTNYSQDHLYNKPFTITLEINYPVTRQPITKSSSGTVAIAIVVVLGFLCGAIFIFRVYRKRSLPMKDNDSENSTISYMTKQSSEKVVVPDSWEINPHNIKIIEKIGEGSFGTVYSATICTSEVEKSNFGKQCGGAMLLSEKTRTAVKLLKEGSSNEEINDFCEEIALMKKIGYHRNIVNLIGCCTVRQPICLIVEFLYHGNLLNYLRQERTRRINKLENDVTVEIDITSENMLSYAWQIASGMEYLASKNVVHRDLAARNILVGHDHLVKISDFGLSRQVTNEPIYVGVSKTKRLPVKWMSVEAIFHKEFTTASDVWSYGIVLFEIITLGGAPYPFINYLELCKLLKSGYRMEKPDNCPDEMYNIMCHCWNAIPAQRPTFSELREHLEKIMEQSQRYFSFEIDSSKAYYNVASFKSIPSDDEEEHLFSKDCEQKVITIKPMTLSNTDETLVDLHPINGAEDTNRYISPQSMRTATDAEKMNSFDNPNFHFSE